MKIEDRSHQDVVRWMKEASRWLYHASPQEQDGARQTLLAIKEKHLIVAGNPRTVRLWNACWILANGQHDQLLQQQ